MAASYQASKRYPWSMNTILQELRSEHFCSVLNLSLKSENPTSSGIWFRYHHGTTFTSWGEKITITVTVLDANSTLVDILSECGMPTQIVDWGKNKSNVNAIFAHLEKFVPQIQESASQVANPISVEPSVQPSEPQGALCAACSAPLAPGAAFCTSCGTKVATDTPKFCSQCGTAISGAGQFCTHCGNKIR